MKKKSTSKSAFFNLRVLIASILCLFGVFVALIGSGAFAQTKGTRASQQPARSNATQDAPGTTSSGRQTNGRSCPPGPGFAKLALCCTKEGVRGETSDALSLSGDGQASAPSGYALSGLKYVQALLKNLWRPTPTMPGPLFTFEGICRHLRLSTE